MNRVLALTAAGFLATSAVTGTAYGFGLRPAVAASEQKVCNATPALELCVTVADPATAGSAVRVDMSGTLAPTTKSGDQIVVTIPSVLDYPDGSFPVAAPDGSTMGTLVVSGGVATITWNSWIESHPLNASWSAFLSGRIDATITEGTNTVTWQVDGVAVQTPITGGTCLGNCSAMPTSPSKWANTVSDSKIASGIASPTIVTDGTTITWTDTVDAGQAIDCSNVSGSYSDHRDPATGWLKWSGSFKPTVVSCDPTSVTATFADTVAGRVYILNLAIAITDKSLGSWADHGTVTTGDVTKQVSATAVYTGGASGTGTTPSASATSTATATPTAEGTSTPAPSTPATETATASATQTATLPTIPVTETITATATSTPSETATATPTETASATATDTGSATSTATSTSGPGGSATASGSVTTPASPSSTSTAAPSDTATAVVTFEPSSTVGPKGTTTVPASATRPPDATATLPGVPVVNVSETTSPYLAQDGTSTTTNDTEADSLPYTGADSRALTGLGFASTGLGAALLVAARRRGTGRHRA